jgi:hypothetical protein
MGYVSKRSKTNNSVGDSYWQNVSQEWEFIDAISKGGLDFKIDEYALTSKLLHYRKPSYTTRSAYTKPTTNQINVPTTTMSSL